MANQHTPRDIQLLDALDRLPRRPFEGAVWRVAREGRDPLEPSRSVGRWSDSRLEVLYTSLDRDGAIAEVLALLLSQPVFPSQMRWFAYELSVRLKHALTLADMSELEALGIAKMSYHERRYDRSREIAEAAHFLGFDGLIVPSARWNCQNAVLFTDRVEPANLTLGQNEPMSIDWEHWRIEFDR